MKTWLVSHRGYHEHLQENTIAAFDAAYNYDIGYLELDVRVTADNIAVIHHNNRLASALISDTNFNILHKLDANLTTLADTLDKFGSKNLIIELKDIKSATHVANYLVNNQQSYATSFYPEALLELAVKGVNCNQLFIAQRYHAIGLCNKLDKYNFGGISVNKWYMNPLLNRHIQRRKKLIMTYTINNQLQAKLFRKLYHNLLICSDKLNIMQEIK